MNTADVNPLTLPSLALEERSQLPSCSAIYFVLNDQSVLYIGRTSNLSQRWGVHHRWHQLRAISNNVRIAWLECNDVDLLPEIERALIEHFQPALNGSKVLIGKDSNHTQVTSHIRKELAKRLKFYCTEHETTITETVEIAIQEFLDNRQQQGPSS